MFFKGFEKVSKEILHGGKGDGIPDDAFKSKDLKKGMKHESEHTHNKNIQKEISKDHLVEDKKYYEKLEKVEKKASALDALKRVGSHLHKYRRDYLMGAGVTAAGVNAKASIDNNKEKK